MENLTLDPHSLLELTTQKMPFGKHAGSALADLPEPYLVWFSQQGFPENKLGKQLALIYTIKLNGLEQLLEPLRGHQPKPQRPKRKTNYRFSNE